MLEKILEYINENERQNGEGLAPFLKRISEIYNLKHIAYFVIEKKIFDDNPQFAVTYPSKFIEYYYENDYAFIDPVLLQGSVSFLPFDWNELNQEKDSKVRQLFDLAYTYQLGVSGLTIPVRGRRGEQALFSVTKDISGIEWELFKKRYMTDLLSIAQYVHNYCLANYYGEEYSPNESKITPRELDVLYWCAEGKSIRDISDILGISDNTVAFHLNKIRNKLNCLNTTHAVSKAIARGLIVSQPF